MIEINGGRVSDGANEGWMRRAWDSVRLNAATLAGKSIAIRARKGTDRPRPGPESEWKNGKLVIMGRNQIMKKLIQDAPFD